MIPGVNDGAIQEVEGGIAPRVEARGKRLEQVLVMRGTVVAPN